MLQENIYCSIYINYLRQGGYVFVVVCLSVCLSVCNFAQKSFWTDLHAIFREDWQWVSSKQIIQFGGDPDRRLDTGIVFRIRHYWEIRKVVNGDSFIHTDSPDGVTGNTFLGGVCIVPVLSSFILFYMCVGFNSSVGYGYHTSCIVTAVWWLVHWVSCYISYNRRPYSSMYWPFHCTKCNNSRQRPQCSSRIYLQLRIAE